MEGFFRNGLCQDSPKSQPNSLGLFMDSFSLNLQEKKKKEKVKKALVFMQEFNTEELGT